MLRPDDTRRAHTIARAMRPAFPSYRTAYASAAAHVAASKRTAAAACPTRHPVTAWTLAAMLTACAWLACPAIAAAAH